MKPHKWYNEIVAWANGAEIETRYISNDGWTNWDETIEPKWYIEDDIEYRIKPQPKEPQYLYVYDLQGSTHIYGDKELPNAVGKLIGKIKLETDDE